MKRLLYLLFFLIQAFMVNGQKGYFVKDSLISVGVKVSDGGPGLNAKQCKIIEKKNTLIYSPDEVKEYGLDDERTYVSRIIKINNKEKKVFLERLNRGKMIFYYYKGKKGKKFFLESEKDSGQLVEIPKKRIGNSNYKDIIKSYTQDCNSVSKSLKLLTFSKPSLTKFVEQYNSCSTKPFPFSRVGLTMGYGVVRPVTSKISDEVLKNAVFENDNTFNAGIFADIPILRSYFSLHPEVYFQKNAFSSHSAFTSHVEDIIINTTSLNIPLLIRYTYPNFKLRPYGNIGSIFSYNLRDDNAVYETVIFNNVIEIEERHNSNSYSEKQIGYAVGVGIQFNMDYRRSFFFELRNNNLYGFTKETYATKSFQCLIGINF